MDIYIILEQSHWWQQKEKSLFYEINTLGSENILQALLELSIKP